MTPEQIKQMRADMQTGTPGPWRESERWSPPIGHGPHETNANGNIFWGYSITGSDEHGGMIYPTLAAVHNFPDHVRANARRIARVPDMEAEILRLRTALSAIAEMPMPASEADCTVKSVTLIRDFARSFLSGEAP